MFDNENIIEPITKKTQNIFITIIKNILVLLMTGFIMLLGASGGAEIYTKNSLNRNYTGGWLYHEFLNPVYGLIGIIIYILIILDF